MPKNIEALFQISLNDLIFERLETSVSNPVCLEYGTSGKKDTRAPQMKKPIAQLFLKAFSSFRKHISLRRITLHFLKRAELTAKRMYCYSEPGIR